MAISTQPLTFYPTPTDLDFAFDIDGVASIYKGKDAEAYAQLFAAAPELLAALIGVVAIADRETDEFIRARAAIAKARSVA
jgi:hypothetical protein